MVRRRVNRRQLVRARGQTTRNRHTDRPIHRRTIHTLEERKLRRIRRRRLRQAIQLLNHHMRMPDDIPLAVHLLRRRVVVRLRVDEIAELEVVEVHDDIEVGVGGDGAEVGRVGEFGGGDVGSSGDDTHGGRVAGTGGDLFAVGDGEVRNRSTEVDEIVGRGEGGDLAGGGVGLAVLLETGGDDGGVEGCGE